MIIKTSILANNEDDHLVQVSYTSKSWNGNGTLCDDGWDNKEAEIICRQNGFKVSMSRFALPLLTMFCKSCNWFIIYITGGLDVFTVIVLIWCVVFTTIVQYGKAISLVTDREDFVLTGLDCPCDERENLEHCSATRYEDSEVPCLPEEAAGVRCYNRKFPPTVTHAETSTLAYFKQMSIKAVVFKIVFKLSSI